jgi:hypothetical protein
MCGDPMRGAYAVPDLRPRCSLQGRTFEALMTVAPRAVSGLPRSTSGGSIRETKIGNGAMFECRMRSGDSATFRCGLPVTLLADTGSVRDDPARPTPPPSPGICSTSYAVADGISVLNQRVVRSATLTSFNLFCSWPVAVFQVSPTGEVR